METVFAPVGAARFHLDPGTANIEAPTSLNSIATPTASSATSLLSPHNPLFWFGAIAALTFGLAAVSTSVRVGPARVSAAVGK